MQGIRASVVMHVAALLGRLAAMRARAGEPSAGPLPASPRRWESTASALPLPAGGGDWLAREAEDGTWHLREAEGGPWRALDGRSFGEFRVRVADAGGVLVTVQLRQEAGRLLEIRQRSRGHSLDGDRRDCPAVARRCDLWAEFFYYRAGQPCGHERLCIGHLATATAGGPGRLAPAQARGPGDLARAA